MILDDTVVTRGVFSEVCTFCKHKKDGYSCDAFDNIPRVIWFGEHDHRKPYLGDNGIQFEAIEDDRNNQRSG